MAENQNPTEQQTYKQHPIPQNVLQVEFKLIGGLTLRQFGLLAIFAVIAFLIYSSGLPNFIRTPLALMLALGGAFISLVPIQDRPADVWLKNFLVAISYPTERVWRKNPANLDVFFELREAHAIIRQEKDLGGPGRPREEVSQYLRQSLKEGGNTLDLAESEFLKSVQLLQSDVELPAGMKTDIKAPASPNSAEQNNRPETFERRQEVDLSPTLASEINYNSEQVIALPTAQGGRTKFFAPIQNIRAGRKLKFTRPEQVGSAIMGEKQVQAPAKLVELTPEADPTPLPLVQRVSEVNQKIEEAMGARNQIPNLKSQIPKTETVSAEPVSTPLITPPIITPPPESKSAKAEPDTSTARLDSARLAETSAERAKQAGQIASLAEELERMRQEKLNLEEEVTKQKKARFEAETYATLAAEYQKQIGELANENQKFSQESKKAQEELRKLQEAVSSESLEKETYFRQIKESQKRIDELAREKTQATDNLLNMQRELRELRLKQRFAATPVASPSTPPQPSVGAKPILRSPDGKPAPAPFVKDRANIINGYVKGKDGSLIKNAVIIIKDQQGEPVRALKTNELGQFAITTPVVNGVYSLEVSFLGETFDIMAVEAYGTVLDPLDIVGH